MARILILLVLFTVYFSFVDWAVSPFYDIENINYNILVKELLKVDVMVFFILKIALKIGVLPFAISHALNYLNLSNKLFRYSDGLILVLLIGLTKYI